jgi:hypothetical protein
VDPDGFFAGWSKLVRSSACEDPRLPRLPRLPRHWGWHGSTWNNHPHRFCWAFLRVPWWVTWVNTYHNLGLKFPVYSYLNSKAHRSWISLDKFLLAKDLSGLLSLDNIHINGSQLFHSLPGARRGQHGNWACWSAVAGRMWCFTGPSMGLKHH